MPINDHPTNEYSNAKVKQAIAKQPELASKCKW